MGRLVDRFGLALRDGGDARRRIVAICNKRPHARSAVPRRVEQSREGVMQRSLTHPSIVLIGDWRIAGEEMNRSKLGGLASGAVKERSRSFSRESKTAAARRGRAWGLGSITWVLEQIGQGQSTFHARRGGLKEVRGGIFDERGSEDKPRN